MIEVGIREGGELVSIYIALLRGINVGGKNSLPMRDLVTILERLGATDVRTYIQSGNAVFRHDSKSAAKLAGTIGVAIRQSHGFEPRLLVLEAAELERAMAANPFPEAEAEPKSLHFFFLAAAAEDPDLRRLEELTGSTERFRLGDRVLYLHAPNGIGRSKLAAGVEKSLGVVATGRNFRTVSKIHELAGEGQ